MISIYKTRGISSDHSLAVFNSIKKVIESMQKQYKKPNSVKKFPEEIFKTSEIYTTQYDSIQYLIHCFLCLW